GLCPLSEARFEIVANTVKLLLRDQRAHVRVGLESMAYLDLLGLLGDALDHLVEHVFLDVEPGPGAAALAVVEEDRHGSARDGGFYVGVVEDDVRRFAAELERDFLQVARGSLQDQLANFGRSGERDLVDVGMGGKRSAGGLTISGNNIDN